MTPFVRRWPLPAVFFALAVAAGTASAQSLPQPPGPWWKSEPAKKELGLSQDQSVRLDRIYNETLPQTHQDKDQLDRLEARLSDLIGRDAEEPVVMRQVD